MAAPAESFPVPLNPLSRRLESIDILRGLLMLLMAIDHAREYFTSVDINPTDPLHSWPALFATRWMTHLCAPGFIALAGASVYLQRQRGKSADTMKKLLLTRGLWLIFLEVTLVDFGWSFTRAPIFQVIWAIGVSMIFLGLLQSLSTVAIGIVGAAIVTLHNLFDSVQAKDLGRAGVPWELLHQQALLFLHGKPTLLIAYPIVPWIGVICLGYAFGPVALIAPARRQRIAPLLGGIFLFIFALLRVFHGYGDHNLFQHLATPSRTVMSFLNVEKYPPSLQYLLATLGVLLLLYTLFDVAVTVNWLPRLRGVVEVYGRVPFFYYVLHIYLLHAIALALTAGQHLNWRFWLAPWSVFYDHLDGWGYGLSGVYMVWLCVVVALYLPCVWFSRLKARRRDWWLSYL